MQCHHFENCNFYKVLYGGRARLLICIVLCKAQNKDNLLLLLLLLLLFYVRIQRTAHYTVSFNELQNQASFHISFGHFLGYQYT